MRLRGAFAGICKQHVVGGGGVGRGKGLPNKWNGSAHLGQAFEHVWLPLEDRILTDPKHRAQSDGRNPLRRCLDLNALRPAIGPPNSNQQARLLGCINETIGSL